MTTYKDWLFFLIIAKSCLLFATPPFSFQLDKKNIQVGESIFLQIEIPKNEGNFKPLVMDELLQQQKEIKLLERSLRETPQSWVVLYELTAHEPSPLNIPAIQIKLGANLFSTESQAVSVNTSRADDDMEIRAEYSDLTLPFPWRLIYLALIWIFTLGTSFWFLIWSIKKINWRRLSSFKVLTPQLKWPRYRSWLRSRLNEIELKIKQGEVSAELVDEVESALRYFLQQKTHQPIKSWTSREIRMASAHRAIRDQAIRVISQAETFKYSNSMKQNPHLLAIGLIQEIRKAFRL